MNTFQIITKSILTEDLPRILRCHLKKCPAFDSTGSRSAVATHAAVAHCTAAVERAGAVKQNAKTRHTCLHLSLSNDLQYLQKYQPRE